MSRNKSLLAVFSVLAFVLLALPFLSVSAQDRTNFIYVRPQEIVSVDPAQVTESQSGFITRNVYSRLVDISYDGTSVEPDLAESWEASDDGLTWTFHLRPDVKFHDGSTLKASDVVYSFNRLLGLGEGEASTYAAFLGPDSVTAPDDQTVVITLTQPYTAFLQLMGIPRAPSIVSQAYVEANATADDPWAAEFMALNAMGTGPYKFVEWIPNDSATMVRFDDYYGGPAPIEEVVSLMNEDDTATRLMMERGEVDAVQRLPEDIIRAMQDNSDIVVYRHAIDSAFFWTFITTTPPFDDVRVRQAIVHAIDYDAIMNDLVQDGGTRMNSPVFSGMDHHADELALPEHDVELSRSLLEEAGYGEGELEVSIVYPDFGLLKQLAVILQANLAEAGINATIDEQPFGPFLEAAGAGDLPFFAWVSEPNYPQAIAILERFHSDMIGTGLGGNISNYSNPEYDAVIDQIRTTTDEAELADLYEQAQEILANDVPWLLLYQEQLAQVAGSWVNGFDFGVYNYLDMRDVSVSH